MQGLITIIIVVVLVAAKVMRAVQEQNEARDGSDGDGWWEEDSASSPSSSGQEQGKPSVQPVRKAPAARPQPSAHVQEILRQLQQQVQPSPAPPAPVPVPVPTPRQQVKAVPVPEPEAARRYLDGATPEASLEAAARASAERATGEVYQQSSAWAFPPAQKGMRRERIGVTQRLPIHIRVRGKVNLRRTVLISEILGPPRAFDV